MFGFLFMGCFLHICTSLRKKPGICVFPSLYIHSFKFYQLHALMGEFGGKRGKGGNKDCRPFADVWLLRNRQDLRLSGPNISGMTWPKSYLVMILLSMIPLGNFMSQSYILILFFFQRWTSLCVPKAPFSNPVLPCDVEIEQVRASQSPLHLCVLRTKHNSWLEIFLGVYEIH